MKSYTFWFMCNKFYNSSSVKYAPWWKRPFLLMGGFHEGTCVVHEAENVDEALESAVLSFRSAGLSRQCMGQEY